MPRAAGASTRGRSGVPSSRGRTAVARGSMRALVALSLALHPVDAAGQHSIIEQNAPVRASLATADSAYAAGNTARAEREYRAVLQVDPTSSRSAYRLAQLTGDGGERVRLLKRYVALEPRDAWGFVALGDALAGEGDIRAGLAAYDVAERLAPGARDVSIGRIRLLGRARRTDDAIAAYARWTAANPGDAQAWRELAAERRRAGRQRSALVALQKAQNAMPEAGTARSIEALRAATAPWVEGVEAASRDSDGNDVRRTGVLVGAMPADALVIRVQASGMSAGDDELRATVYDAAVATTWRPVAALRLDARAGVAWSDTAQASGSQGKTPTGELRLDWRQPGSHNLLNVRAARTLVTASPTLVRNGVLRDELTVRGDRELVGPFRLRGVARAARISAAAETNRRTLVGGGVVLGGAVGEIAGVVQQIDFAHASTSGYFAPRSTRLAEVGVYSEVEMARGVRVALDVGAGAQRVTPWSTASTSTGPQPFPPRPPSPPGPAFASSVAVPTGWSAALRAWSELVFPLAPGRELRVELEAYDSSIGGDLGPSGQWRYGSASLSLRWALR